ncbi:MAG: hypothetical protein GC159_14730 [Phycisphaera sp.]|nr:hypothetical protein [Phycisphaera sp.]
MNPKDRLIILIAVVCMVGAYTGAGMLIPGIKAESQALQLTAGDDLMENMPPDIAILYTSLASFRGLFVDILWARATQMKQDGKHYEAAKLADLITKLQPRFPKVWAFHAWNMAYNISVTTHTPQERWMWVQNGIKLLRDKGIPYNPNNVLLYKELGWIFLHKIGQFSDEMHWYYKKQLAMEWQEVLGTPREGMVPQLDDDGKPVLDESGKPLMEYASIADMRRIARAYELYINTRNPTRKMIQKIKELSKDTSFIADDESLRSEVQMLGALSLQRMKVNLDMIHDRVLSKAPDQIAKVDALIALNLKLDEVGRIDPLQRLLLLEPDLAPIIDQLTGVGMKIDMELLRRVHVLQALRDSGDDEAMGIQIKDDPKNELLMSLMDNESTQPEFRKLMEFTEAKVIDGVYKMDPVWMLALMEGYWYVREGEKPTPVPADWRHPGSHGMYWAALGVRKSKGLLRPEDFDVLNTDRQLLHGLQSLLHNGKIIFDPVSQYYRTLADPRFIDAYDAAVFGAYERVVDIKDSGRMDVGVAPDSFKAGHENFLIWAIQALYFYGDEAGAEKYLKRARKLYGNREPHSMQRYAKTLKDFVMYETIRSEAMEDPDAARTAVNGYITRAFEQGYATGDVDQAEKLITMARQIHAFYQQKHAGSSQVFEGVRRRMDLPPFSDMLAQTFVVYMLQPVPSQEYTLHKSRVWKNADDGLKRRTFDFIRPRLYPLVERMRFLPAVAFPEPPGMDEYRKAMKALKPEDRALREDRPFETGYERK